jgi:hypothetical protein
VVIATVFLTIIGMAGGYVLGERHRQNGDDQPSQSQQQQSSPVSDVPSSAAPTPSGAPCPPEASEKAVEAGRPPQLSQVMKIVTDNHTTVWICRDPAGDLYYQSKTGGVSGALVQGKNGLFLLNVQKTGSDQYEAYAPNDGNRIEVSRTVLQVRFSNGKVQSNPVTSVE